MYQYIHYIDPNAPENFICNASDATTIHCTWVHPIEGLLLGYELNAMLLNSFNYYSDSLHSFSIGPSVNRKVINGLSAYAGYLLSLKATFVIDNTTLTSTVTAAAITHPQSE